MSKDSREATGDSQYQHLTARMDELEGQMKEREINTIRAIKTFYVDLRAFHKGEKSEFPYTSLLGLVFSYLRPRAVLYVGGVGAVVIAVVQIWMLVQQNNLITQQNELIASQTRANNIEAISGLLTKIGSNDISQTDIIQLEYYGDIAVELLVEISIRKQKGSKLAKEILSRSAARHNKKQKSIVLTMFLNEIRMDHFGENYFYNYEIYQDDVWMKYLNRGKYKNIKELVRDIKREYGSSEENRDFLTAYIASSNDIESMKGVLTEENVYIYTLNLLFEYYLYASGAPFEEEEVTGDLYSEEETQKTVGLPNKIMEKICSLGGGRYEFSILKHLKEMEPFDMREAYDLIYVTVVEKCGKEFE